MQSTDGDRILVTAHEHQKAGPDWLASPLQDTDFAVQNPILLGEPPKTPSLRLIAVNNK